MTGTGDDGQDSLWKMLLERWQRLQRAWGADLEVAFGALTVLPFRRKNPPSPEEAAHATRAYPVVGLTAGVLAAVIYWIAMSLGLWSIASAVIAVGALVIMTGTRAEVGVAAFADALYHKTAPKDRVDYMRTPHLGVHGLLALLFLVTLKIGLIAAAVLPRDAGAALIAAVVAGRAVIPVVIYNMPQSGKAQQHPWTARPDQETVWTGALLGIAFMLLFLGAKVGIAALAFGALVAALAAWRVRHELGGHAPEGMAVVLSATEIAVLLAAVVIR